MMEYSANATSAVLEFSPHTSSAAVKRAVLKFAPKVFTVEVLPPAKHGNAYSYGLRIFPTSPSKADTRSMHSDQSWSSDYEVWRRWEDCLSFQDLLEEEYATMAADKRRRLKHGRGVKKDGIYVTSDFAASWDSLPAGPDYQDIATDIHVYLPKLSKKGSLFRPNLVTITHRGKEFEALIDSLMGDHHPTLVEELRDSSKIRDFFGFWRRDQERLRKLGLPCPLLPSDQGGATSTLSGPGSVSRSSFFPPFFLKIKDGDGVSIRSSIFGPPVPESVRAPSPPPIAKCSPKGYHESSGDDASYPSTPPIIADIPIRFVLDSSENLMNSLSKSPHCERPPKLILGRSMSPAPLSPIGEFSPRPAPLPPSPPPKDLLIPNQPRRKRSGTFPASRDNRNCRLLPNAPNPAGVTEGVQCVYATSFVASDDVSTPSPRTPNVLCPPTPGNPASTSRFSFSTETSGPYSPTTFSIEDTSVSSRPSSFQSEISQHNSDGHKIHKALPVPEDVFDSPDDERLSKIYPTHNMRYRATQSSTNLAPVRRDFIDDLLPPPRPKTRQANRPLPGPLAESDDLLDSFFGNMSLPSANGSRRSSGRESITCATAQSERFPSPFQHRPPGQFHLPWSPTRPQESPDYSKVHIFAAPSSPSLPTVSPSITIKATYEDINLVMKIERTCGLAQLRQRLYEKLSENESVLMSECFVLAYPKPRSEATRGGRPRSQSTSIVTGAKLPDPSQLNFIVLEPEWTALAKSCGPKLQLFLLEP